MKLSLVMNYIFSLAISKKSYILVSFLSSFLLSIGTDRLHIFDKMYAHIEEQESIVPLIIFFIIIGLTGLFIIVDFVTGIVASRYEGSRIQSSKWGVTIGKFFGLFLYSCLAAVVILLLSSNYFVLTMIFAPVILTLLKEYISIGENFERRFGKKAYMFTVIDKVFDILEMKFFKTLEEKEICGKPSAEEIDYDEPIEEEK